MYMDTVDTDMVDMDIVDMVDMGMVDIVDCNEQAATCWPWLNLPSLLPHIIL